MGAGLAGDVDDPTVSAGDHAGEHVLGGVEDAPQVDVDGSPPLVGVVVPHRADRSDDAGVVDEQVDRAEATLELGDRVAAVRRRR